MQDTLAPGADDRRQMVAMGDLASVSGLCTAQKWGLQAAAVELEPRHCLELTPEAAIRSRRKS
jgi:hypothetical protein